MTNDSIKRLNRDSILYFLGKLLPAAFGLASVSIFVRLVGKEMYGHYTLVFSFILLLSSIGSGWINQGLLRFISNYDDHEKKELKDAANLGSFYSYLFTGAFLIIILPFVSEISFWFVAFCLVLLFFAQIYSIKVSMAQGELNSLKVLAAEVVRVSGSLAFSLVVIFIFGIKSYTAILYGVLAGFILSWLMILKGPLLPGSLVQKIKLNRFFSYGWPFTLWFSFSYVLNLSDRYLIAYFDGLESVGVYSAVYDTVFRSLTLVMAPVAVAAHPIITLLWNKDDREGSVRVLNRSMRLQLAFFIPVLPVLYFASPYIIKIILGAPDTGAERLVLPIAAGSFVWQIAMLAHKPMELRLSTKMMVVFVSIAMACNLAGNLLLLPLYGYVAAAYTTLAGSLIYLALVMFYCRKNALARIDAVRAVGLPVKLKVND